MKKPKSTSAEPPLWTYKTDTISESSIISFNHTDPMIDIKNVSILKHKNRKPKNF